jgi:hypothetical protein
MELDDETVAAIARDLWVYRTPEVWKRDVAFVKRAAPIFAKHLPDPRPTETEVREALAIDYWHDSSFRRVLRLPVFRYRPKASKSRVSDDQIKALGWYPPWGMRTGGHAADAVRVLICTLVDEYPEEMME